MKLNKTILITGANKGLGRAIAQRLAIEGYDLVIHCHKNKVQLDEFAKELTSQGVKVEKMQFDLSNRQETVTCIEKYLNSNPAPYGVVCNAGIAADTAFPAMTSEEWDGVIHTNLDSFYNLLHPLVMPMVSSRKPGRIVTMSSVSGITGNRGQVNYSASKAGIIGASKALAVELAKRNITVNCVAPGLIDTEMVSAEVLDAAIKMIPAQRMGRPEEVAALVSFLMSEDASYITRQVISVNGGMV
jgi:3-oxoacyl-[acyl-carrier protein] reductase